MIKRVEYLAWATRHYGHVRYNLASSGIPSLQQSELDTLPGPDSGAGWQQLCDAIARHHSLSSKEVVATLGASHGLWLAYTAIIRHGDEVLVENPAYEPLVAAAQAAGAVVRRFDRDMAGGFVLDPERVFDALSRKTRIVAITNLHNPSGVRASDEAMRAVAQRMHTQSGFLLVDEIYAPFDRFVGPDGVFHGTSRALGPNVLATGSLTKAYGLGPQRVGWLLGPEEVIARALDALVVSVGELPLDWMNRGVWAFQHILALAERSRSLLGNKRERLREWIAARPSLTWSDPREGLFGLAIVTSGGDLRPAIELGLERHGVLVAPGGFFGIPNSFRLAWSLPENLLGDALDHLDTALRDSSLI